jgi:hypothetical protein
VTVALAVRRIAPGLLAEARAACSSLSIATEDWGGGIPRQPPRVVITSIEAGDRRIPEDVCGLLEATPGVRAVVCSAEPLIKPRIDLAEGRVMLLSPPIDRARLVAVLRAALDVPIPMTKPGASHRFEVLRRGYWIAWARGADSPALQLDESNGLTIVAGTAQLDEVVRCITADTGDAELANELAGMLGPQQAAIHLSADTAEWRIYWPRHDVPLWMCSPKRMPTRWQIQRRSSAQRFQRISGFPQDQLVLGWAAGPIDSELSAVEDVVAEGGPATIGVLASTVMEHPALVGAVVEVR